MPVTQVSSRGSSSVHDLQRGSPPHFKFEVEKPRGRSTSPISSRSSASASSSFVSVSASKTMYTPPPLTWRTAFQDAKAGIRYTKESFPPLNTLSPLYSCEPVSVEAAERVELLEQSDYCARVRVLRTGVVGLIPSWNIEGALERLTRINTAFNEAATCPVEARTLRRRDSESSATSSDGAHSHSPSPSPSSIDIDTDTATPLSHVHARCVPFVMRVRYPECYSAYSPFSDDSDDSSDDSDDSNAAHSLAARERGRPLSSQGPPAVQGRRSGASTGSARSGSGSGARKSVNFAPGVRPQVVFRYPSAQLVHAFLGEKGDDPGYASADDGSGNGSEGGKNDDEDDEWWWHGWEEPRDDDDDDDDDGDDYEDAEGSEPMSSAPVGGADPLLEMHIRTWVAPRRDLKHLLV